MFARYYTYTAMSLADSDLQSHNSVLPAAKWLMANWIFFKFGKSFQILSSLKFDIIDVHAVFPAIYNPVVTGNTSGCNKKI